MKCLALIGGITPRTLDSYWQTICAEARKRIGPDRMPNLLVHCRKADRLAESYELRDWDAIQTELLEDGRRAIEAGADALVVCGSALNPAVDEIHGALDVPVIDLAYALSLKLQNLQHRSVAVLGIGSRREEAMWKNGLEGINITQPELGDREWLSACIQAANAGQPVPVQWKVETNRIVSNLRRAGAQALVLADPALSLWIKPGDSLLYPLEAAEVHAWVATMWALESAELPAPGCVHA